MEVDEIYERDGAWADLQHAIAMMLALFGGCAAVAAQLILRRATRVAILQWLAPIEAVARRLLLLDALQLPAPNQPAPFVPKGKLVSAYADRPAAQPGDDPAQWCVRFHVLSAAAPSASSAAPMPAAVRAYPISYNAFAIARRMEALRRLFEDRALYAHRLAARVHHAPARARKAFAPYRYRATAVLTLMRVVQQEVDLAFAALNTS